MLAGIKSRNGSLMERCPKVEPPVHRIPASFRHTVLVRERIMAIILLVPLAISLASGRLHAGTINDALNARFLDYTQNACKITPWFTVKAAKAVSFKDGDKGPAPDVVPTTFS